MSAYPGPYAVPGSAWPGLIWPGNPPAGGADVYAIFTGSVPLTYPQYVDVQTQRTLTAQPGREYDIEQASGYPYTLPEPPAAGGWIPEGE